MIKLTTNGPEMDPGELATQTIGAVAAKGGGKSYLAGVAVEQLAAARVPFIVIDPIGNWCWLRLAADGQRPGLPVVGVGGAPVQASLEELPSLTPGEFFLWSPSWLKYFGRVRVAKKWTFDGSSTP